MKPFITLLLTAFLVVSTNAVHAQNSKVKAGAPPAWITQGKIDYGYNSLEADAEDGYFDLSYEKQVSLADQSTFYKKVYKILNESGVENMSEITVAFDPSFQQVTFHDVRIIRGDKVINKLQLSKFTTYRQEEDADRHLYNGTLTALLILDDVRKGDIIEYAYTLKGMNPIFSGKYSEFFSTAYSVPVGRLYYKLVTPEDRPVYIENLKEKVEPEITKLNGKKEYQWLLQNVQPIHAEDNMPTWYEAYPMVMVSEFNDWQMVRSWAAKLFPANVAIGAQLQKKIASIQSSETTNEARVKAALRFVQDDIRYLGIEMGEASHKPNDPNKVFTQRYGDCKDKSYLLVTMLQAMGIKASPVLINTTTKKTLHEYLPSARVFDHVTVQANVDGKVYWFDPTSSYQRGPLQSISYPDYQSGLVLGDSSQGLTAITHNEPGRVEVKETFSIPDMSGTAMLKVVTTNSGLFADEVRSDFKNRSMFEIQKSYKNFYASYFEKIKSDSIAYNDNEQDGKFTVTEFYSIKELWKLKDGVKEASFNAFIINGYLRRPKDDSRATPMRLYYPANYKETIEVNLPEDWSLSDFDEEVECNAFLYKGTSKLVGRKLMFYYEYKTFRDYVGPSELPELLANYKLIDDKLGWTLTYNSSVASTTKKTIPKQRLNTIYTRLTVFFLILLAAIVFAVVRQKKKKQKLYMNDYAQQAWLNVIQREDPISKN
jgi:transglutaminase-like putative cysteine protease